ncbi:MAG: DNA polymerase III subunit delta', partial [Deltaproteobacteria bacterium]|nr:DNA polymerase III subunit delta' [Deltaproteobacteria bacterium]
DEELVNMDLAELIRSRAARESIESLIAKLGLLEETRRALDDNTNARLTLDLLLMRLADL